MLFKPDLIKAIEAGRKTQTRRVVKDTEYAGSEWRDFLTGEPELTTVRTKIEGYSFLRLKWRVGRDYAICPGRGKPQVGRILLHGIRRERLQDISEYDALAEGCEDEYLGTAGPGHLYKLARAHFKALWADINGRKSWDANPDVWVLDFEYIGAGD